MEANQPDIEQHKVLLLLTTAYNNRVKDLESSTKLATEALEISRTIEDKSLIAKSLNHLALFHMIKGSYQDSMLMSEEAIRYFEESGDEKGLADAKYNLAGIYYKTDNYHLGLTYLIDCLGIYRKFNDYHNQSRSQKSLGTIYEYFGDQKNAIEAYEQAIYTAQQAGDLNLESNAYNPLSGIYLKKNDPEKAKELIDAAINMKQQTGDVRGLAFSIYGRGKVYSQTGEYEKAETDFLESIRMHKEVGERLGLGMALHKLANLYVECGKLELAKEVLMEGIEFSKAYNIVIIRFKCDFLLYRIYKMENNPVKALDYLERYLKEKETVINTQTLKIIENYELITRMESMEQEKEKAEIIAKKELAEHASKMKQEFLSAMSHEIRTPLNAILSLSGMLKAKSDAEETQLLHSLKLSANKLLLIVNDILDYTRLDAGEVQLEMHDTNLRNLLQNIQQNYIELSRQKALAFNVHIDPKIGKMYELDESRLSQILDNLLSNAVKFTTTGGVSLEIELIEKEEKSDHIRFKVTDTGEGIKSDNNNKIFDSFSHAQAITLRKQGGTGLGLAIVQKLAALYESKVEVKSIHGAGSVFYLDLKLKTSDKAEQASEPQEKNLKDKICLLVEDNELNAFVARKLLSRWGVITELAVNGVEAVAKSKEKHFDFVLMDIHMPEMNGYDAVRNIRLHQNPNQHSPIFALTADVTAADQKDYVNYFNGFLWKPLEVDKLFNAINTSTPWNVQPAI